MSTDTFTLFFALLTLVALGAAVVIVVALLTGRGREALHDTIGRQALPLAAVVATVSTLGSLYLSEIADFTPCRLCWVQRGFMYPLAVVLWIAAWRRAHRVWMFAAPYALAGGAVAVYHYLEQRVPSLGDGGFCDASVPCTVIWVWRFGFVSIPFMALAGFVLIAALMWLMVDVARADEDSRAVEPVGEH